MIREQQDRIMATAQTLASCIGELQRLGYPNEAEIIENTLMWLAQKLETEQGLQIRRYLGK